MGGTTHNELDPRTSVIKEENVLQACPQADWVGTFSQMKFLSFLL